MEKITSIEQLKGISDEDYVLITKLKNTDHVQKDDKIHKKSCNPLWIVLESLKMPTNKKYYHVKSDDKETLDKYKDNMCGICHPKNG